MFYPKLIKLIKLALSRTALTLDSTQALTLLLSLTLHCPRILIVKLTIGLFNFIFMHPFQNKTFANFFKLLFWVHVHCAVRYFVLSALNDVFALKLTERSPGKRSVWLRTVSDSTKLCPIPSQGKIANRTEIILTPYLVPSTCTHFLNSLQTLYFQFFNIQERSAHL